MNRAADRIGRLDIEWLAIKAGLKPANRVTITPERAGDFVARARAAGLSVEFGPTVAFPGRAASQVLYIAPDGNLARELVAAEAPLLAAMHSSLPVEEAVVLHTRLGLLLGFPSCCVGEFAARVRRGVTRRPNGREAHEDFVAAECAARASQRFLGRLNDLSMDRRVRIVTFYPCRYDCPAASSYAAGVFTAAETADPEAAAVLRTGLLGERTIAVDGTRGPDASLRGETLTVEFSEF